MIFNRERPSFEAANNVTVKRCFFAYEFATQYLHKDAHVFDIGCADGYGTSSLSPHCTKVTGMDYSQATVNVANSQYRHLPNISFVASKVPPLAIYSEKADVITAFQFIEHIHHRGAFIREVNRALKVGGTFICTTPNRKKSLARNPYHVFEYTFAEMEAEISSCFDEYTLLGLHGNDKVNAYYDQNRKWVHKALRLDVLGLHKILPSSLLYAPYNLLTSLMRNDLMKADNNVPDISTADFYLSEDNLDSALDIFVVARKKKD
jgi:ubiquinone/menaquinone biosynthesis C-methylase UbiE